MKGKITVQKIVILGVLLALYLVLNEVSKMISLPFGNNLRIGLTFLPVVCAAIFFGPIEAAIVGGLGDMLGAFLFPTGPFFPGFTLTAVLTGLVHGFFLKKKVTIPRLLLSFGIVQFLLGMLLNTLWLSILYGKGFLVFLPGRAIQAALSFAVECVLTYILNLILFQRLKKMITQPSKGDADL